MSARLLTRPARLLAIALLLAGAAAAAVIASRMSPAEPQSAGTPVATRLSAELARCRALGVAAQDDTGCRDAWRASRREFLGQSPEGTS